MAEYIDRMALRNALYDADAITMEGVRILNQFPAANVKPVVHGEWVYKGIAANGDEIGMCSACQRTFRGMKELGSVGRFCPNCGADMREQNE